MGDLKSVAEKPYTFQDLETAMAERNYFKSQLANTNREISIEEGKLRTLREREGEQAAKLAAEEKKVLVIASSIKKHEESR